jgi:cell division ATPase FtsA
MSLFSRKKNEQIISVSVVTTSAVYVSVVKIFRDTESVTKPVVLFSTEIPTVFRGMTESQIIDQVTTHLDRALHNSRQILGICEQHICVLGDSFVHTQYRTIHQQEQKSFRVTEKMINDLIHRDQKKLQEDPGFQEKFGGWGIIAMSPKQYESNGYRVARINEHTTNSLSIHYSTSLVPAFIIEKLVSVYEKAFHTDRVIFTSLSYGYGLLYDVEHYQGMIITCLDGLTTTLNWYERGIPKLQKIIPTGLAEMTTLLAESFEVYEQHVPEVLRLAKTEHIIDSDQSVYSQKIIKAYKNLDKKLEQASLEINTMLHETPRYVMTLGVSQDYAILGNLIAQTLHKKIVTKDFLQDRLIMTHGCASNADVLLLGILESLRHVANH